MSRIEFCKGGYEGHAIYLVEDDGCGYRLWGGKCWGKVRTVWSTKLTIHNIDIAIEKLKEAREVLTTKEKEGDDAENN